jgi:hypothetical protein
MLSLMCNFPSLTLLLWLSTPWANTVEKNFTEGHQHSTIKSHFRTMSLPTCYKSSFSSPEELSGNPLCVSNSIWYNLAKFQRISERQGMDVWCCWHWRSPAGLFLTLRSFAFWINLMAEVPSHWLLLGSTQESRSWCICLLFQENFRAGRGGTRL